MRVVAAVSCVLVGGAAVQAFVPAPMIAGQSSSSSIARGRKVDMVLGNLFSGIGNKKTEAPASSSGGHLNLRAIPKDAVKPTATKGGKTATLPRPSSPKAKVGTTAAATKKQGGPPQAKVVNGKLQGYFSPEQVEALREARRTIPSNSPAYWQKIAAQVPGQTADTCKAMAQQIAFDKSAGLGKNFWGGYVEVKETEMYVDKSASAFSLNRVKEAFGFK